MSLISNKLLNKVKEKTILENAQLIVCLYESQPEEDKIELKWLYERNKEGLIRKFKLKFHSAEDDEIENFMRIYLHSQKNYLGYFLCFLPERDREWKITKTVFMENYLKETYVGVNYGWFIENNESGLHFP